jgi:hypothetical protein
MKGSVGEFVVRRIDGRIVVEQADRLIYAQTDLIEQCAEPEHLDHFGIGPVRYRVVGPSVVYPGAMLCERVA